MIDEAARYRSRDTQECFLRRGRTMKTKWRKHKGARKGLMRPKKMTNKEKRLEWEREQQERQERIERESQQQEVRRYDEASQQQH